MDRVSRRTVMFTALLSGLTTALGSLSGVGVGALAIKGLRDLDKLGRQARAVDTLAQEFQALELVARLSGVETNKVTRAISLLASKAGEAAAGTGGAKDAFALLNINIREFTGLNTLEQFARVADAFSLLENRGDRAFVKLKLFGEEVGRSLGPLLSRGGDVIRESVKEIEALGGAFDKLDIGRAQVILNDFTRVNAALRIMIMRIGLELAPALFGLGQMFLNLIKRVGGFGKAIEVAFNFIVERTSVSLDIWDTLVGLIQLAIGAVSRFGAAVAKAFTFTPQGFLLNKMLGNAISDAADLIDLHGKEVFEKGVARLKRVGEGRNLLGLRQFFNEFEQNLNERTEKFLGSFSDSVEDAPGKLRPKDSGKVGQFTQVDLRRIGLGGPGKDIQKVSDPALEVTNQLLTSIDKSMKLPRGAVFG